MSIGESGIVVGSSVDAEDVSHGFVRLADGTVAVVDVPGRGRKAGQGTMALARGDTGEVVGRWMDRNGAYHGFVLKRSGKYRKFDVPGATGGFGTATTAGARNGDCVGEYGDETGVHGFIRKR